VNSGLDRRLDRIFQASWVLFCLGYYLPGLISGDVFPTSKVWFFERQLVYGPFANFVMDCLRKGVVPAWCPHFYSGFPYIAYPPNFFYFLPDWVFIYTGQARGLMLGYLVGYAAGGVLFYRGLRKFELSAPAALCGLLLFVGGAYFNISAAFLTFPLLMYLFGFWAVAGILRDRPRLRYFAGFFLAFGLADAWDVEQVFYLLSAIFLSAFFLARPPRLARLLLMLLALAAMFLFELGIFLNLAAYMPHTVRAGGFTFNNYISAAPVHLPGLIVGAVYPLWDLLPVQFQANYIGMVAPLLALFSVKRLGWLAVFAALFLAGFFLYAINWRPMMEVLYELPVVNKMAMHYTAGIVPALGIALLAAVGAEELLKGRSRVFAAVLAAVCLMTAAIAFKADWVRGAGLIVAAGFGLAAIFRPGNRRLWPAFLLLAIVFEVSYSSFRHQPRATAEELADRPEVIRYLAAEKNLVRFWPLSVRSHEDTQVHPLVGMNLPMDMPGGHSPLGYWRMPVMRNARLIDLITPGYLKLDKGGKFDGLDLGAPRDAKQIDEGDLFWLKLLNVGNLISRGARLSVKGIEPNGESGDLHFYKIPDTLPRWILVGRVEKTNSGEAAFQRIAARDFDPETTALVEDEIPFYSHQGLGGKVLLEKYSPGLWRFRLSLPSAGAPSKTPQYMLALGETYLPGWRAFVPGYELKVVRANYAFMGVVLPPGEHELLMVYFPYQGRIGLLASATTIMTWLLIGCGVIAGKVLVRARSSA